MFINNTCHLCLFSLEEIRGNTISNSSSVDAMADVEFSSCIARIQDADETMADGDLVSLFTNILAETNSAMLGVDDCGDQLGPLIHNTRMEEYSEIAKRLSPLDESKDTFDAQDADSQLAVVCLLSFPGFANS